jgi:hypothetical protein
MAVSGGPIPEVVNADLEDFPLTRTPQETFGHRPLEHRREKRHDIQAFQMFDFGKRVKR